MRIQVIQGPVCFFTSIPAALVHALNLFVTATGSLVLLRTRNGDKGIDLHRNHISRVPMGQNQRDHGCLPGQGATRPMSAEDLGPPGLPGEGRGRACRAEEGSLPIARVEDVAAYKGGAVAGRRVACLDLAGRGSRAGMLDWLAKWRGL